MTDQSILISVQPQWCELIASGKKTWEIRKTRPKIDTPFKCYIYQTKPKDVLITIIQDGDENYGEIYHGKPVFIKTYGKGYWTGNNQKVIGEFVCDYIKAYEYDDLSYPTPAFEGDLSMCDCGAGYWVNGYDLKNMCLTYDQLLAYGKGKTLYGWHISDLVIYDKPRELSEFGLTRAPQSWGYVQERGDDDA